MDDFSHITEELEVVEEGLKFRFNTARCVAADEEKVPKAENFELFRVRRAYHFNKDNEDHVILTIHEPECLVLINKQLKSMQQVRTGSDAPCGHELQLGAAAHQIAVKGLGCVVEDLTVEWVAAPDEDCGTAVVEPQPSSIEMDVNIANFNKQSEPDENLNAVKEKCNSFSPVKLNSSEIASGTHKHLARKRKKSSKQRSSKRLKRKLNSSIAPEAKCDDMSKIEQALIVALKNSESCKSSEANRLHNIGSTKMTRNAKERSNINGDVADFKEKLVTNRINEVCKECTVRLEDISSILKATYKKRFNSRTDQIQEAAEVSICFKKNRNTELNSGEKPSEHFVAVEENLIRDEDNLYIDNIGTKTHKNAEKVAVCSNITRGHSALRKILEAPLKNAQFNKNGATATQHNVAHDKQLERFYKCANDQAKQIEEELIPNAVTNIKNDSQLNKDLTETEKNSNKMQHKLDFNKATFHCDPDIIIKEEFNCFMEDHAFLQNESQSGTSSSLRNSDFNNETNEENSIYGQNLFQKGQSMVKLEEYERTAERVHKSEIIEEFEETFMNCTKNFQAHQNATEEASGIFPKSEESSNFADEEHEETFFASQNSQIPPNLIEQVCEVEIFIPDYDDDESESGYTQEHSQIRSSLEEKIQNTEICQRGDIAIDEARVQKNSNCNLITNDGKKSDSENDIAIMQIDSKMHAGSLEENQHNCDPSEDVHTCNDKVATIEITIKDTCTQDCSQTNANSSKGNVESQGKIQEQVSFDSSSCNSSEDVHSGNDELANMDTSSSKDIHKIQENLKSRDMHCDQNTHCIEPDAEDAQKLQKNREFPEKVSWGAQHYDKNVSNDAERTYALEHSQIDAHTSGDTHRIEKIIEALGKIHLDCRRTEDHDSSDSDKDNGARTITHLQTDTNSSEDKLHPPVRATLNAGNALEQNSYDGNEHKDVCVSELSPMTAISSEDAHQSQENLESPIPSIRDENKIHDHDTCDSNKDKTTVAVEFSQMDSHSTENAHVLQDNSEPPVDIAWDGKNVLEQSICDTNGDKSVRVREPSPAPTIVSEDAHQSQENFELPVEVARDGRKVLKQNSCDAIGDKSVCVREPSPAPTNVSEDTHQTQENFEPPLEVARDGRNVHEQNNCDDNEEGAQKSQGSLEPSIEVAQDGRNVQEQNSCEVIGDKSVCIHESPSIFIISSEDTHQSQENLSPREIVRDGTESHDRNTCDGNEDENTCVRKHSEMDISSLEDVHKLQENLEPLLEVTWDRRNIEEQNNGEVIGDKSVCIHELPSISIISSEDTHQSQESLSPKEVVQDGRESHDRNTCDGSEDESTCTSKHLEMDINSLEDVHKFQENLEPLLEVTWAEKNVQEQNSCEVIGVKSVCIYEPPSISIISSEDTHQSQESLSPKEVVHDRRESHDRNTCDGIEDESTCAKKHSEMDISTLENIHKLQENLEPLLEVSWDGTNVQEQNSCEVIGDKSVCIHEPPSISIISSKDTHQSQENLSPKEVVQDGRESHDRNTCDGSEAESTCTSKHLEMDINSLEDVHKLQENLEPVLEVTWAERNVQEQNSCEVIGDKSVCIHEPPSISIILSEDTHQSQENLSPKEVVLGGSESHDRNNCDDNEDKNTCSSKHYEMDISSLEDVHKLQENLGPLLEVTWDGGEVQKQNNCHCSEDKCACAMELSPVCSSSSEDANKPQENLEIPIGVAWDEKQIPKENSCDNNEDKSACVLEFSQMDMSSAEDARKLQENLELVETVDSDETKMQQSNLNQSKYDGDEDKCACAFEFSPLDTDSSEDARKLQKNLDPLKEIDLGGSNMQQCNSDVNEDKSACTLELLQMDTSASVDVNELHENPKLKDNKNENACALECSLKISTSSKATNFEPQEIMGFDEENIPAFIVTKIPHDFVGFLDEESKTPLLNLILTDDFSASEDKSDDLYKTEESFVFSSNVLEFYKFSAKRIRLIEENLTYVCNKYNSLYKQHDFDKKPILNRKNAREVVNSRNLTKIVDHDYVKKHRNMQSNSMLNREQGTQTLATKEDFANKINDKPVFNQEGQQDEDMEQLLEELIQEHIKSLFAQDGIDEEIATDQSKNNITAKEEKEKGPCDHPNNSEEVPEIFQNKKNSSDLKPAVTPKHTQVFEYITELSNDSIISERQLETDHGDGKGNVANDKKSSDIFMEVNDKNEKLFKCNQCNFKVNKENHLKIHSRVHILSCWCNICPETFADTTALQKHVKVSHSCHVKAQQIATNNSGEKPFHISSDKPSHTSGNEPSQASSENLYKCGYCNYTTSYIHRLQHHKKVHDKEKLYECGMCNFTTLREWKFNRHQNAHSNEEELRECDECGFISIYKHEWDMHQQLHSGKKLYQCDMCSFSTAHVGYFHAHRGFHLPSKVKKEEPDESEDRLRCEECDYRSDLHSSLLRHGKKFGHRVAIHPSLSQSRLVCSECNYVANSYVTLKQHLMTHIDLKPCHFKDKLTCSKCKKVCLTHKDLKRHVNKEHPGIA